MRHPRHQFLISYNFIIRIDNILSYKTESEKILFEDDDFILLPDFKWDLKDINTLYLQAIVRDKRIRSLRDLRYHHLPILRQIRKAAYDVVQKWNIGPGGLRLYVHYQPSYCKCALFLCIRTKLSLVFTDHFHVHIVQVNYSGFPGMSVGQAHLLEDIISLLEISGEQEPSIFERMTLSYTLGQFHGLYDKMTKALN